MVFNSYVFIFLMLPISIAGYYLINKVSFKGGQIFLLFSSLIFIGYMNIAYLFILLPSVLVNYLIIYMMNHTFKAREGYRRGLMVSGIVLNVLLLAVFKYCDFFIDNINVIFGKDIAFLHLLMPLGISFYTFKQISVLADYHKDTTLSCTLLEYGIYMTFYPQFTQGPIVLQSEFILQLRDEQRKSWDTVYASKGLYRFTIGLAKKVLIADTIARAVDGGYSELDEVGALGALVLILGYTLQIYFDFSGYSDMAIGLGNLFHIDLPENFDSPYKARSIDEFWDRWHITLTRFFTRYVYIPLGGSRKGHVRTYVNVFIIFLLSGLWHGAEWSFVIWGIMHGVAMLISRMLRELKRNGKRDEGRIAGILKNVGIFLYVSVAWVFFRASDTKEAVEVITKVLRGGFDNMTEYIYEMFNKTVEISWLLRLDVLGMEDRLGGIILILVLIVLTLICMLAPNSRQMTVRWQDKAAVSGRGYAVSVIMTGILFAWCVLSLSGVTSYVYWNF